MNRYAGPVMHMHSSGHRDRRCHQYQRAYSSFDSEILDDSKRETKARKIARIVSDYYSYDSERFSRLHVLDVGCSGETIIKYLSRYVDEVAGIDIDVAALRVALPKQVQAVKPSYLAADGLHLPFRDEVFGLVVCNHVYEHVPDPRRALDEIERVLRSSGVCYFAAGNRLTIIEGYYHLPFLSWLPKSLADLYVRLLGRSPRYEERHLTLFGLRRLTRRFRVHDYTLRVIGEPERFCADDMVRSGTLKHVIVRFLAKRLYFLVPTYLWVLEKAGYAKDAKY